MIKIRRAHDRGQYENSWLNSHHTFSFGEYYDPAHMGISNLRVINDDVVQPGAGFATHPHRDMEIVSYVLEGELAHKDSMGNGSTIKAGDFQRMSAGTGVTHSEYNPSNEDLTRFLQIWLLPKNRGGEPGYEQKHFPEEDRRDEIRLVVSPDGREGSVSANSDAELSVARLGQGVSRKYAVDSDHRVFIQVSKGRILLNGEPLSSGDSADVHDENQFEITGAGGGEALIFKLPAQ